MDIDTCETSSRHKCLIYEADPSELAPVVVPFLTGGLQTNWRCLYLGSPESIAVVKGGLVRRGIDVVAEIRRGGLVFSSDREHLKTGFAPRLLVEQIAHLVDEAVRDGFQGLCAAGDMAWELGTAENFEHLLEYEALLENVFREKPLQGICLYNSTMLPAHGLQDALLTHQCLYDGERLVRDNCFYVPPDALLAKGFDREDLCEWMSGQIMRIQGAERERDAAIAARTVSDVEREYLATELRAARSEQESLSYSIAHDLSSPLRHIEYFVKKFREKAAPGALPEHQQWLDHISERTSHMQRLLEGLLALGIAAQTELRKEPVDLAVLADEAFTRLRWDHPDRTVQVEIEKPMLVMGDLPLLRSVIDNLVSNAWKFTAKTTEARIELRRVEARASDATFRMADNGAGFSPTAAGRLFGVFERLHAQSEYAGTGMGLATVRRIVERHGGRIWAEGNIGAGAQFYFTLPIGINGVASKIESAIAA